MRQRDSGLPWSQVRNQLNALRRKAAYRAAKRAASAAAAAPAVECDSPRHGTEPVVAGAAAAGASPDVDGTAGQYRAPQPDLSYAAEQPAAERPGHVHAGQQSAGGAAAEPVHASGERHSRQHDQQAHASQTSAQPDAQTAAWLNGLWQDAQRDCHETDGAAGTAMREQQDWLLYNGYECDW